MVRLTTPGCHATPQCKSTFALLQYAAVPKLFRKSALRLPHAVYRIVSVLRQMEGASMSRPAERLVDASAGLDNVFALRTGLVDRQFNAERLTYG